MVELLRLSFDQDSDEFLVMYTMAESLEKTGILTSIKIFYEYENKSTILFWNSFQEMYDLLDQLKLVLNKELFLHPSIKKNIGFYENQYRKKEDRKNLIYENNEYGRFWIGVSYSLFSSCGKGNPDSWLYNDKDGSIVFEITPAYPWCYSEPEPDETFITYSEWMKTYQPYLKRVISKEVAQKWLVELQELTNIVEKISKTLPCGGMLDCGGCIHIGKRND